MLKISIAKLQPSIRRLTGATIGQAHAEQLRGLVRQGESGEPQTVILDFGGVEGASASYLKRLLGPLFAPPDGQDSLTNEVSLVATRIEHTDLEEDIQEYLAGKGYALIVADTTTGKTKFRKLLGRLDRAAAETFEELRQLKKTTAAQLYARHPERTSNQTAWNNRLAQLVEMRIARRSREGRFWIYQPTVT